MRRISHSVYNGCRVADAGITEAGALAGLIVLPERHTVLHRAVLEHLCRHPHGLRLRGRAFHLQHEQRADLEEDPNGMATAYGVAILSQVCCKATGVTLRTGCTHAQQ